MRKTLIILFLVINFIITIPSPNKGCTLTTGDELFDFSYVIIDNSGVYTSLNDYLYITSVGLFFGRAYKINRKTKKYLIDKHIIETWMDSESVGAIKVYKMDKEIFWGYNVSLENLFKVYKFKVKKLKSRYVLNKNYVGEQNPNKKTKTIELSKGDMDFYYNLGIRILSKHIYGEADDY